MKKAFLNIIFLFLMVVVLLPVVSYGAEAVSNTCDTSHFCNPVLAQDGTACIILQGLLALTLRVGAVLAVVLVMYCGFLFVVAGGNVKKLDEAKKMLYWALGAIALLLVFSPLLNLIIHVVLTILGHSVTNICQL